LLQKMQNKRENQNMKMKTVLSRLQIWMDRVGTGHNFKRIYGFTI
jgi:hypothetical protein